jgi:hypothetical protein
MRQVVKALGFNDIRTLENEKATERNIKNQLRWLQQDIGPNDRVLIYFSGHGSQMRDTNGDEPDQLDEFLVAYDFNVKRTSSGVTASGYIVDDYLNSAIIGINSRQVYVFVDACQSGSSTKSLQAGGLLGADFVQTKFLRYKGMPSDAGIGSRGIAVQEANSPDNFVALSAAQDTEYALAGPTGSYFTLGLMESMRKAQSSRNGGITPAALHKEVVNFVHKKTTASNRFTPVLSGSRQLQNKTLKFKKTEQSGEYWEQLASIVERAGNNLKVVSNKAVYQIDNEIVVNIDVPVDGYLNIITVSSNDRPQVLFPNKFMRKNKVRKGLFSTQSLGFDLVASDPKGQNYTVAIVTKSPLDLYSKSALGRDLKGEMLDVVADLDATGLRDTKQILTREIEVRRSNNSSNSGSSMATSQHVLFAGGITTTVK